MTLFSVLAAMASVSEVPKPIEVTFQSGGERMVGHLYLPAGASAQDPVPAVVVTGAWFTIKEQMPTTYAREFVRRGTAAFVFDFRGFGESGGAARNAEHPGRKAEDIAAAARWLATRPEVDRSRLSGFAMCASTGYMANAIKAGAPLRSFAATALWVQDAAAVEMVYGGREAVDRLIQVGTDAHTRFQADGTVLDVPAAGPEGSDAIMQQAPYYQDPNRGLIPQWDNRFALMSWRDWLTFDSLAPAKDIRVPSLVLHSDNAALPDMARRFYAELGGEKEIWWSTEGHMDLYDQPTAVQRNVTKAIAHAAFHLDGQRTDAERIEQRIREMVQGVDAKAWGDMDRHFARVLTVDYSSLGGPKGEVRTAQLLSDWETFHARYHTMRHTYTGFDVVVNGRTAEARYAGTATLTRKEGDADVSWTVAGDYVSTLEKQAGRWVITGTTFTVRSQHGTP